MWQLHVWMQFGPQWAGGQAESTAGVESSVRSEASPAEEVPTPLPHPPPHTQLLAHERLAVCTSTEGAHCSTHKTQMAMLTVTATSTSGRNSFTDCRAERESPQGHRFHYLSCTLSTSVPSTVWGTKVIAENEKGYPPEASCSREGRQTNQPTQNQW